MTFQKHTQLKNAYRSLGKLSPVGNDYSYKWRQVLRTDLDLSLKFCLPDRIFARARIQAI